MKKTNLSLIFFTVFLLFMTGCSQNASGKITNVTKTGDNAFSFEYDGEVRDFIICLPEKADNAPAILMLHGLGSNASGFMEYTHMEGSACPRGYAVIYVSGLSDSDDPSSSSGWNSGLKTSSRDDAGMLKALSDYLITEYNLRADGIFAAGFSNGGFMIHRLAAESKGRFCAVASVAGKMPASVWKKKPRKTSTGFLEIYGEKDDVVPMKSNNSCQYSPDPAIEDVMEYWAHANVLSECTTTDISPQSELTRYYSKENPREVWSIFIRDGRHSWPEELYCGFDINELILDFFDTCLK